MSRKNEIVELIYNVIDSINQSLDDKLEKSPKTVLYGKESKLDSLGLVNLIVVVEESIEERFSTIITIADERAISQKNSPFRTIETLANYIRFLLKENADG